MQLIALGEGRGEGFRATSDFHTAKHASMPAVPWDEGGIVADRFIPVEKLAYDINKLRRDAPHSVTSPDVVRF